MSPSNLELLAFCVARKPDNLEPVLKRRRNRVQHVGGRYEHHIRKIILDIEVMIVKCEVLFRVEDFKQCGRRIAAEIHSEFVDFIQHYQRVHGSRLLHHLNNLARQSADVRPAMPSYFRFIANAAQTKAHKLATGCFGNRTTETGLPHAWRSNEAEDRTFGSFNELPYRKELEYPFFYFLEAVVICVKYILRGSDVAHFFGFLFPGNRKQPVEIIAGYRALCGHWRHLFESP